MAMTSQGPLLASDLAPSVSQSAVEARLGDQPNAAFHVTLTRKGLWTGIAYLMIGLGFIAGGIAVYGANPYGPVTPAVLGLLGVLSLIAALYCLLYGVIYKSWHVYIYEHGFIYTRGSQAPGVFRWDQVEAIWFQIVRRYYNGIYMGTNYKYRVRRQDGVEVILNDRFTNISALGELVNEQISQTKLPQVVAAYDAGQTIAFGSLSLSKQGLSNAKGTLLPWQEIKDVAVQDGVISVRKANKWLNWSNQPMSDIPNALLFIYLAKTILQQNAGSTSNSR